MLTLERIAALLGTHGTEAECRVQEFALGARHFSFNSEPSLMGVINLSPDSWYRESVCLTAESAIRRGQVLHAQGASIVDIGAESTLAKAARVGDPEQRQLMLPVVKGLRQDGILVSVETYEPAVARACLEAGANVLNLTGLGNQELFRMVAANGAAAIICYVQGQNVRQVGDFDFGSDPIALMHDFFAQQIELASSAGLTKIFIDPGLGFYY